SVRVQRIRESSRHSLPEEDVIAPGRNGDVAEQRPSIELIDAELIDADIRARTGAALTKLAQATSADPNDPRAKPRFESAVDVCRRPIRVTNSETVREKGIDLDVGRAVSVGWYSARTRAGGQQLGAKMAARHSH